MSKKKQSGLSKKVPAIFEGLPDLDAGRARQKAAGWAPALPVLADWLRPSGARSRVAVEISATSLKVLLAQRSGHEWRIVKARQTVFEATPEGKRARDPEGLRKALGAALAELAPQEPCETRVLATGKGVFTADMERPEATPKEMREAVLWQIAEKLPFAPEASTVLYEEKGQEVFVAAVETAARDGLLDLFHGLGLHPAVVTVLPVAYDTLCERFSLLGAKNALLLHVGAEQTSILAFRGGRFQSVRQVPLGGEHVSSAMMGTLVVDNVPVVIRYQEAAALKEEFGLPTPNLMPTPDEPKLSQLAGRVRPIFEKLVTELRSSMLQFQKQYPEEKLTEVVLSGGGALLKGVDGYLADQLKVPVRPLDTAAVEPKLDLGTAALAGVLYAEPGRLNFAGLEDLWEPRLQAYRSLAQWACAAVSAFLLLVFAATGLQLAATGVELKAKEIKLRNIGPAAEKVEALDSLLADIESRKQLLESEIARGPHLGATLRELSRLVPPAVVLTSLTFKNTPQAVMDFTGIVRVGAGSPDTVLAQFLERLNQSPFFERSNLESRTAAQDEERANVQFLIRTKLVVPGGSILGP